MEGAANHRPGNPTPRRRSCLHGLAVRPRLSPGLPSCDRGPGLGGAEGRRRLSGPGVWDSTPTRLVVSGLRGELLDHWGGRVAGWGPALPFWFLLVVKSVCAELITFP